MCEVHKLIFTLVYVIKPWFSNLSQTCGICW